MNKRLLSMLSLLVCLCLLASVTAFAGTTNYCELSDASVTLAGKTYSPKNTRSRPIPISPGDGFSFSYEATLKHSEDCECNDSKYPNTQSPAVLIRVYLNDSLEPYTDFSPCDEAHKGLMDNIHPEGSHSAHNIKLSGMELKAGDRVRLAFLYIDGRNNESATAQSFHFAVQARSSESEHDDAPWVAGTPLPDVPPTVEANPNTGLAVTGLPVLLAAAFVIFKLRH